MVNASLAEFTGTLLATVVDVPLDVSTKFTVPLGSRAPPGLIEAFKKRVIGVCPEVKVE